MSFFRKLRDKGAFDFIADWADSQNEKLDKLDKKVNHKLDTVKLHQWWFSTDG
ncbi:hypothetical protein [Bacillus sp. Marseille-P3661]|uniref:hypothetical protein n=1 Tax=Bacillus sp. Marseille-P3661 TaxID=1936234 RepID=UPI0015E15BE0|nr:hypothetical protein [Bacillus sp. Marseille-P3661]